MKSAPLSKADRAAATPVPAKVRTLADVRLHLPLAYSEASAERYRQDLERAERVTGRRLHQIAADEAAWTALCAGTIWHSHFGQASAFEVWSKRIVSATRAVRRAVELPDPARTAVRPAWDRLVRYGADAQITFDADGRRVLPNMAEASLATLRARLGHVHPARVDAAAAAEALRTAPADKAASLRRSLKLLDGMIGDQGRHAAVADLLPVAPVGALPGLRDAALDWSRFSDEFLAEIEATIRCALRPGKARRDRHGGRLGTDPLAGGRKPQRAKKVRNPEAARKSLRGAVSWLIRHAWPDRDEAYALASPRDLLDGDVIGRAVDAYVERARRDPALKNPDETSSASSQLARLRTFAARNDAPEAVLWALDDAREDDAVDAWQAREMSASRERFLKLIARDPAVARRIATGPRELLALTRRDLEGWDGLGYRRRQRTVQLVAAAAAMSLQLARPLRTRNVHELTITGDAADLIAPTGRTPAWLDVGRAQTKNRAAIEGPVPAVRWTQIAVWINEVRPLWCAMHGIDPVENPRMFPSPHPGGQVCRATFNKWWNAGMAELGLPGLTPHVMRHVCATLYLSRHPGDYATVAALLADNVATVRAFYARGEGAEAMRLFADVVADLDPAVTALVRRRGI